MSEQFKIILVGQSSVGKTCLVNRFAHGQYDIKAPTVGVDFIIKEIQYKKKTIRLQIWDTAGSERYRNLTNTYFNGAQGVILAFDLTNEQTFIKSKQWHQIIMKKAKENVPILLVGNKNDLPRAVSIQDAQQFADNCQMSYIETSALSANNVREAFQKLCGKIIDYNQMNKIYKQKTIQIGAIGKINPNKRCNC